MKERIYVCHTYYHVYVTFLKELYLVASPKRGKATLVLSKMSNDFENLSERIKKFAPGFFEEILDFDEKRDSFFPGLAEKRINSKGFVRNLINRVHYTKLLGKYQESFVPTDFKEYFEIFVYCDADPIGYYLNYKHIYYHALEDGLNTIVNCDTARYSNRGNFQLKRLLALLNLIFIPDGYSKYCLDMEVNDLSKIRYKHKKYKEAPIKNLVSKLSEDDKALLLKVFINDINRLKTQLNTAAQSKKRTVIILTEPLCTLDIRKKIFDDLIKEYEKEAFVILKRHPRDVLDYHTEFPDYITIDGAVPMEMLNFLPDFRFDLAVSVFTEISAIEFAKESIRLGDDFMDKYEDPAVHRKNEEI